jgi:hypothetical protein
MPDRDGQYVPPGTRAQTISAVRYKQTLPCVLHTMHDWDNRWMANRAPRTTHTPQDCCMLGVNGCRQLQKMNAMPYTDGSMHHQEHANVEYC